MKRRRVLMIAAGLLVLASSAFVQQTVQMYFNGGWNGGSWDDGGTGFYYGSVNGTQVGPGQAVPGMLCDDFRDEVFPGETWSATALNVSSLLTNWNTLGKDTLFGSTVGFNGYLEMAIVVEQAFTNTLMFGATPNDVSEVVWCITGGPSNCTKSGMSSAAYQLLCWVKGLNLAGYNLSQFANLTLFVPQGNGSSGYPPQEMWSELVAAEGGAALMYLLLAGVVCFGAIFHSRRQRTKRALA